MCSFSWTRNGTHFDIDEDPKVTMRPRSGTLDIDISGEKAEAYEGVYQCMARNVHGTAISNNIFIRQSRKSAKAMDLSPIHTSDTPPFSSLCLTNLLLSPV